MTTLLFICTGNTCRSPMAEGIAKQMLKGKEVTIFSAGTKDTAGARASFNAIRALAQRGIDLSNHRSRHVTSAMLASADNIYVMTRQLESALHQRFPEYRKKVQHLDLRGRDVNNPFGKDLAYYQDTAIKLEALVAERLRGLELLR